MTRRVELVGADGTRLDLRQDPYRLAANPSLWGVPPKEMLTSKVSGVPGSLLADEQAGERPVPAPLWILAGDALELDEAMDRLAALIYFGPCRLVVYRSDGAARELTVRYSSGFEAIAVRDHERARVRVNLVFIAHQPYWRSVEATERRFAWEDFSLGVGSTPWDANLDWDAPIPWDGVTQAGHLSTPLMLGGHVPSWPRIEVTGPASSVEVANHHPASHQSMFFDGVITAGQSLVIETEPGRRMVSVDGAPAWNLLGDGWEFWPLHPGINEVSIYAESFDSSTAIQIGYHDDWLTP